MTWSSLVTKMRKLKRSDPYHCRGLHGSFLQSSFTFFRFAPIAARPLGLRKALHYPGSPLLLYLLYLLLANLYLRQFPQVSPFSPSFRTNVLNDKIVSQSCHWVGQMHNTVIKYGHCNGFSRLTLIGIVACSIFSTYWMSDWVGKCEA